MMRTTIGCAVATAVALFVLTPSVAKANNDAGSPTAVAIAVATGEQGDAQVGQTGDQGEMQAEQTGDQGNTQVKQSGDQSEMQAEQSGDQGNKES